MTRNCARRSRCAPRRHRRFRGRAPAHRKVYRGRTPYRGANSGRPTRPRCGAARARMFGAASQPESAGGVAQPAGGCRHAPATE
eukprot:ctg_4264.g630